MVAQASTEAKQHCLAGVRNRTRLRDPRLDRIECLQEFNASPLHRQTAPRREHDRYGAKSCPTADGGRSRFAGDGFMITATPLACQFRALKGIHLAMKSGNDRAQSAFEALLKNDSSSETLGLYPETHRTKAGSRGTLEGPQFPSKARERPSTRDSSNRRSQVTFAALHGGTPPTPDTKNLRQLAALPVDGGPEEHLLAMQR